MYVGRIGEGMSKRDTYEAKAEELIMPIITENGFELVDVEYVKEASTWYLRVYIDKEGGITIDDCELVSRAFSEQLDKEDFIEDSYIMEVSSPGLLRPLKKDKDFQRSIGKELELKTYRMIDKTKDFQGILKAFDKETITIETEDGEKIFARSDLALVRPAIDFD
jgi:ribosome maturation factor RimP